MVIVSLVYELYPHLKKIHRIHVYVVYKLLNHVKVIRIRFSIYKNMINVQFKHDISENIHVRNRKMKIDIV